MRHTGRGLQVLPLVDVYLPNDDEAVAFARSVVAAAGAHFDGSVEAAIDLLSKYVIHALTPLSPISLAKLLSNPGGRL